MSSFRGARVALLEARMSVELADLVRHYGGEPYCVPALRERPLESRPEVESFINRVVAGAFEVVIFLTGVGVAALFREAEERGRLPELCEALKRMTIVCRGLKPAAVLRRHGLKPSVSVSEPYTTGETVAALALMELTGESVALVHYGERNAVLAQILDAWGARLEELCLYEWLMPEDMEPLKKLVREIIEGEVDAVAFTTQVQARHLFQAAQELGRAEELARALNTRTVVAAVGPTCAAALQGFGVVPDIVPEHPKMGAMIARLVQHLGREIRDVGATTYGDAKEGPV